MGNLFSPTHLLIILLIILILFGRGKVSEFMGDFAKGIKSFKKGLEDEDKQSSQKQPDQEKLSETADKAAHVRSQDHDTSRLDL